MGKRVIRIALSESFRRSLFREPPPLSLLHSVKRLSTTTSDDVDKGGCLHGLIGPELDFQDTSEEPSSSQSIATEPFTQQEFAFLRDSLLNSRKEKVDLGKCSVDALSILHAIKENKDGFGDKTQRFLRQFRQKLSESLVVEVLRNVQNVELGIKFFLWVGRQIGYTHTLPVYSALLDLLGCYEGKIQDRFLDEIRSDDREALGRLLNVLVRKYCRSGLSSMALEELGRLKDLGYKPSRATYNALVQVFLEVGNLANANLVHREMSDLNFKMDAGTLGVFAQSLCKAGKWRDALDLIEKEEFVPDTVIYTRMISGLCEASLFEEAMEFLNRMRAASCIPNVVTYRVLLTGCLNKRKLGRCKRILKMMIAEGCYPSLNIFHSLVHFSCRSGDYSYAYKLLQKMPECGCQPGYVVYNILIGGICGNEEIPSLDAIELAEKAYAEMLEAGIVLNKINVCNFARCLCGVGKFEKSFNVIREMMSKGFVPDTSTYSKVIGFLCNASKVEKAFLLFQQMRKDGLIPDVHTYTILIDSFCKAGLIQQGRNWFNEMVRDGCAPNIVTYTALIHAYLKEKKMSDANELFELMLSEGFVPNVVTYTALIDGYCKAGDVEKACQIYARMRGAERVPEVEMYFNVNEGDGPTKVPNVITYGALVDGLCKAHKIKEARNLLDVMSRENCEPNHIVYDALIDGFCKAGKLDEAQEVFARMSDKGYSPNVYTYSSLIDRLFKENRLDLALKVLSKMLENSCGPNVIIYTEMVDGLCKVGKTDEACKLMLMMEEKGCHPNVVTYTAMLDGLGKAGKVDKCVELFQKMVSKGCAPNYITYSVLIKHFCAAGLLDEAHKLLEEMKQTYWPRHMSSYQKVVEGFNQEFVNSLGLLDELHDQNTIPVIPVYRLLINSFQKAGRLEVALELLKEVSSSSPFSLNDKKMYTSLIESLSISHNVEKAFELYVDMIKKGGVPELNVFVDLIKGLVRVNRWENALQLSESLCYMDICWIPREKVLEGN